jgi:N-acetyltransferase
VGAPRAPRRAPSHGRGSLTFDWALLSAPLAGRIVTLEPISPDQEPGLWAAAQDERIWETTHLLIRTHEDFAVWMENALDEQARRVAAVFATSDASSGRVLGSTRFGTLRPEHRSLEIGWTWLSPSAWGTGANVEAKLLMLPAGVRGAGLCPGRVQDERTKRALPGRPRRAPGAVRGHPPQAHARPRRRASRLGLVQRDRRRVAGGEGESGTAAARRIGSEVDRFPRAGRRD